MTHLRLHGVYRATTQDSDVQHYRQILHSSSSAQPRTSAPPHPTSDLLGLVDLGSGCEQSLDSPIPDFQGLVLNEEEGSDIFRGRSAPLCSSEPTSADLSGRKDVVPDQQAIHILNGHGLSPVESPEDVLLSREGWNLWLRGLSHMEYEAEKRTSLAAAIAEEGLSESKG
jgi:hypothetical protein